jgi:undecaprenyl-diphosphatase
MTHFNTLDKIEYPLIRWVQNLDGTALDSFFILISDIPAMLIAFWILIALLIYRKNSIWKPLLVALVISLAIHFTINEGFFKTLLATLDVFRPRPYTIHNDIVALGHAFNDSSFPSSHMAFTTLMVCIIWYFEKRFVPYGVVLIIIMWLSRIHNGMHYPTDVMLGIIMGMIYGFIWIYSMKKLWLEKLPWWKRWFQHK